MGKTFSERFAVKLARFRVVERHPSGQIVRAVREYDLRRKAVGVKKRRLKAQQRRRRALKRAANTELRAVLKMAREVLKREHQ